jgi:hypothetical protein
MNIYVKISGGLGNNLFRIATAYSFALNNGFQLICDVSEKKSVHSNFDNYKNNFFRKLNLTEVIPNSYKFQQPNFAFCEIPKYDKDFEIMGYYQSEKFFIEHRTEILNLFEMDDFYSKIIQDKYEKILDKEICSIHVRRGDYLFVQQILPFLSIDYYKSAIEKVGKEKLFLIFSDDINWCKNAFSFIPNKVFIEGNNDVVDLYLMSRCNHNIIANSSYSWWGAWMNNSPNKIVISPNVWFGPQGPKEMEDIIPKNWYKI